MNILEKIAAMKAAATTTATIEDINVPKAPISTPINAIIEETEATQATSITKETVETGERNSPKAPTLALVSQISSIPTQEKAITEATPAIQAQQQPRKRSLSEILAEKKAHTANIQATGKEEAPSVPISALAAQVSSTVPKISIIPATKEAPKEETEGDKQKLSKQKETFSLSVVLNEQQEMAKNFAFLGKSFVLTGAAGTGKTTAQREIAAALLRQDALSTHTFRVQGTGERVEAPSIAFVAYTRIASGNLKRAIHKDPYLRDILEHNVTTVHNLLEFQPEFFWDNEKDKESMRFIPMRNSIRPLDITHLIIEEATMVDIPLWRQLFSALRQNVQIIFIGDINQLQPVFGASIFNYALASLPVVELTQVYRQKEGSSILDNAHKILVGQYKLIEDENFKIIRGGEVQHTQHKLMQSLGATIPKWYEAGEYDPEQDIILSPWNKQDLGTDSINKIIAQFLGDERDAVVYEVVAGMNKHYLAVGDKVMFNKQVGVIQKIVRNGDYTGKMPKTESKNLLRFGAYRGTIDTEGVEDFELAGYENISLESLMEEEAGEKKRQASHLVDIELETGECHTCSAVGDFSPQIFSIGYALTVHKAQGCEWRKVFFILHKDHSISAHRELFYTAVTRAREQFVAITKDFMIQKAIENQKVKGNNILEKIAYFNSGIKNFEDISFTKTY